MWFRFYDDTPDDPKLDGFSNDQKWLWAVVLCLASRSPVRGRLLLPPDEPLPMDSYVKRTGMTPDAIDRTLEAFRKREMLARDGPVWVVQNWDKRQFESDTSAERTRKYRERKRTQAPSGDGKDASQKRDSDVTVTPSDNRLQITDIIDHHEEKRPPPESVSPPEQTPLQAVEHYLMGRMQAMSLGGADFTAVEGWLRETGGNAEVICKAIDAGLMVHQQDKPSTVPRSARFYSGFVEKQWSRHQAEVNSSGRTTGSAGATAGQAPGIGVGRSGPNARGGERQGSADQGFGFNALTHNGGIGEPDVS